MFSFHDINCCPLYLETFKALSQSIKYHFLNILMPELLYTLKKLLRVPKSLLCVKKR